MLLRHNWVRLEREPFQSRSNAQREVNSVIFPGMVSRKMMNGLERTEEGGKNSLDWDKKHLE